MNKLYQTDWLFETSWEVCNKVGGINTVISTKAKIANQKLEDQFILIGPDIHHDPNNIQEFTEDTSLFPEWKKSIVKQGIPVKTGRWDIPGKPIVFLIDFSHLYHDKNIILKNLWDKYQVDSLQGEWDYIEPVVFGYAAGRVIESFYHHHINETDCVVAQFHEWMTGSGVLYLNDNVSQIATAFTSHATVLGRCIAGNGLPLYDHLTSYNGDAQAHRFNVTAKHSIEKAAAHVADTFTTVSPITARECSQFLGKSPDMVTPNGFEPDFVPEDKLFKEKRKAARKKLIETASALLNQPIGKDALLIAKSGRFEFRNKGIDLFLEGLSQITHQQKLKKDIVAFLLIPSGHDGPDHGLLDRMNHPNFEHPLSDIYTTHLLQDYNTNPIINKIRELDISNHKDEGVKVIYVPVYLDGNDGIFDLHYYDLLAGFDFSAFPSYYEPWGYTPLEALSFSVPTLSTSVAGFGNWVNENHKDYVDNGVFIVNRTDTNDGSAVSEIAETVSQLTNSDTKTLNKYRNNALQLAEHFTWEEFYAHYENAYQIAFEKVSSRKNLFVNKFQKSKVQKIDSIKSGAIHTPEWRKLFVQPNMPDPLKILDKLSKNLWTYWNKDAREIFSLLDPEKWDLFKNNPIAVLESASFDQLKKLQRNKTFMSKLQQVGERFENYIEERSKPKGPKIAYFCMEYGLDPLIKLYSGGLGVLAGDYLKEASDSQTNMIAIGLLYRHGYFKQTLDENGQQIPVYKPQKFTYLPLIPVRDKNQQWIMIDIDLPGRKLHAKVWKINVGSVPLYLLDTDIELNSNDDRKITGELYGGDWDNRLKQEILLGVGGIRLMKKMGITADVYHLNEGHAALTGIERIRHLIEKNHLPFSNAVEIVRSSSLFTTHTPVPAGHDAFTEDEIKKYFSHYPEILQISWNSFMAMGRTNPENNEEKFSMSFLASHLSQEINGVSKLHGDVTKDILQPLYPGYFAQELEIGYVTNGAHYPTWTSPELIKMLTDLYGKEFFHHTSDQKIWKKIESISDKKIWELRKILKGKLLDFLRNHLEKNLSQQHQNPRNTVSVMNALNKDALVVGFARRFATYKRASLIFNDIDKLSSIVNHPQRPVIFLFSGKAHPKDIPGQDLIKRVVEISKMPQFIGKIIFLEDYNMHTASYLVSGVDVWLNNPTRPMEASGTSGIKASFNGVLNLSVLDGWWDEGYVKGSGWALSKEKVYHYQHFQNELDALTIYQLLNDEVIPEFFERNHEDVPEKWIGRIKKNFSEIVPEFTMNRMITDYHDRFYSKLNKRQAQIKKDDYKMATDLAEWKLNVADLWDKIEVLDMEVFDSTNKALDLGTDFTAKITVDLMGLDPDNIGIEIVFMQEHKGGEEKEITGIEELKLIDDEGTKAVYACAITPQKSGVFNYGFRMFPKNKNLVYRHDFPLLRWI